MDNTPNPGELTVEQSMRIEVARWPQRAFHDFSVEVGNHQVGWRHGRIIDAAGLDHHQRLAPRPVDAAGVSEGMGCEPPPRDFLVGFKNFLAKGGKQHDLFLGKRCGKAFTRTSLAPPLKSAPSILAPLDPAPRVVFVTSLDDHKIFTPMP